MNSPAQPESDGEWVTVDELAASAGLTVRTTRYYAGLGLLPPPVRRGRIAWYGARHRARLDLIRALQDHGFTLAAIERYLSRVPLDAGVEDLALQRAMLTSWTGDRHESLTRRQLSQRAGRRLTDDDLELLERLRALRRDGDRYEPLAPFREQPHSEQDKVRFERTLGRLRQLTLEAVVAGFQRAANQVITRSLS